MIAEFDNLPDDAPIIAPALLHCWKHHAGYIAGRIAALAAAGAPALRLLPPVLLRIGASQMDLYHGGLAPQELGALALNALRQADLLDPMRFQAWLAAEGYRVLALADGSRWVLRWGHQDGRYVHLHPARYAPLTLRVRAPVLKTAIAALCWAGVYGGDPLDVALVNQARRELLQLSPVRSLAGDEGVGPLIALLRERQTGA